MEPSEI